MQGLMIRFQVTEAPEQLFSTDLDPVARMQERGPCALTTAELVSVLIAPIAKRGKHQEQSALDQASRLLETYGGLRGLSQLEAHELINDPGLSPKSGARLAAIGELAKRLSEEDVKLAETLSGAEEAYRFLKPRMRDLEHEVFSVIFLNQKHGILSYRVMFNGSIHASSVHPREVVKAVLKENAAAVIFAHNHPSGHVSPSPDDLRLTEDLKSLLSHLDVRVVDHMILGGNGYFSFAREGLLR